MSWLPSFWESPPKTYEDSSSEVSFTINGKVHTVPPDLPADTKLVDYVRDRLHFTGSKFMCREGSCGSCVMNVEKFNPTSKKTDSISVPSCLLPIYACAGLTITTIEGIGERNNGYHPLQKKLAEYNGTQCGFCSPGMVMSMYSLLKQEKNPKVQDVEDLIDGQLCRCTGYRPILAAFKSAANDGKNNEVMEKNSICTNGMNGKTKPRIIDPPRINQLIHLQLDKAEWFRPMNLNELNDILKNLDDGRKIRLVVGNTSIGVYPDDDPVDIYIDMKGIQEFYVYNLSETACDIGACVNLSNLIKILGETLSNMPGFEYCGAIARHMKIIANTNVRNVGCWAGNLMLKKYHPDFPSDIFTILETIKAKITIKHYDSNEKIISPLELLNFDMKGWYIMKLQLQAFKENGFNSYKIMARQQNTHAYINAAFLKASDSGSTLSMVFGGISGKFSHATETENYLNGKALNDPKVLRESIEILLREIHPDPNPLLGSVDYRTQLAANLYYKYLLGVFRDEVSDNLKSGADGLVRPISSGTQSYDTNILDWPVSKPIHKLEALAQCAGEVEYIMDIPKPPNTVFAYFVLSTVGNASIDQIDPAEALKMPGVIRCLTAKDIPGKNDVYGDPMFRGATSVPEELFSSGPIHYVGQPVALVIAKTSEIAKEAASFVKVTYKDVKPPVVSLEEAMKNLPTPIKEDTDAEIHKGDVETALKNARHIVKGRVKTGSQFPIYLETMETLCVPIENVKKVYTSSQWIESSHQAIAQVLGVHKSSLNLKVQRLGGSFGGKITRNNYPAVACCLASHILNKPVFTKLDLPTNMESVGKRPNLLADYQVGFNNDGKIEAVDIKYYVDCGCSPNETIVGFITGGSINVYDCPNWSLVPRTVITNTPANTWMRAPGNVEALFVTEAAVEHVAKYLNKKPWDIKLLNMKSSIARDEQLLGSNSRDIHQQLMRDADIENRYKNIQTFNENNRWKKKGLAMVPMEFDILYLDYRYTAIVSIFKDGGTVAVAHGGIEMGQGINTKIAQVCAHELNIPMEYISVKATNTLTNPNGSATAASTTSELNCKAVIECCQILKKRMQPFREGMNGPAWEEIIANAVVHQVDLCATHMYGPLEKPKEYPVYGEAAAEVTIDVLTGQYQIDRVDILFDCGQSLNPEIDIGQVEGAFVMGLGYFLCEKVIHDPSTGKLLTNRLWEYFAPTSHDIPADFRITLLKNAPNPDGVLNSKTAGEPPLCMSCSALFAIQSAIHAARADTGDSQWYPLDSPATVESVYMSCNVKPDQLVFK